MFTKMGDRVDTDLHVRDLVQSNLDKGLQIKFPICFDCFDRILMNVDESIKDQSVSIKTYSEQLGLLEKELALTNKKFEEEKVKKNISGMTYD